jgi:hypothetical protein
LKTEIWLLSHLAYSPGLAPSDNHVFGPLRDVFHGCWFADSEEVKDALHMWPHACLRTFITDGIKKLVVQSNVCVEKLGDYIEK